MKTAALVTAALLSLLYRASLCLPVDCYSRLPPMKPNVTCDCRRDTSTDWRQDCYFSLEDMEDDYSVVHKVSEDKEFQKQVSEIKVTCHRDMPYRPNMFTNASTLDEVRFVYLDCPFPDIPFAQISGDVHIHGLVYKFPPGKGVPTLNSSAFLGLQDSLKQLTFSKSKITALAEDVFYNLTGLTFLSLVDNELRTLPRMVFSRQEKLKILDLSNNLLEYLPENIFDNLPHLKFLYLYKNSLEVLPPKVFHRLISLKLLELRSNRLNVLSADTFKDLTQLNRTSLSRNRLQTLPENIFHSLTKANYLDISSNPFLGTLPEDLLMGMKSLRTIKLENCNLENISEKFFSFSENLTSVNLRSNSLHHLPLNIFRNNSILGEIDLSSNKLQSLPYTIFSNNVNLEKIALSENNITTLPPRLLNNLKKVKKLSLQSNSLLTINRDDVADLSSLEELDVSNNNLASFELGFSEFIAKIDLSRNRLKFIPNLEWSQYIHISYLNLENNQLSFVNVPLIYKNPMELRLGYNNISTVSVRDAVVQDQYLSNKSDIGMLVYLSPNPLACDCKLAEFFQYVSDSGKRMQKYVQVKDFKELRCSEPPAFAGKETFKLSQSNFTCPCKESNLTVCRCTETLGKATLNCDHLNLTALPSRFPKHTKILHFESNDLASVEALSDPIWQNVEEMYFDNNNIQTLKGWTNVSPKLKKLSLRGNKLTWLSPAFRNNTSSLQNLSIMLGSNPWDCSCPGIAMKPWLIQNNPKIGDFKAVFCSRSLNGSNLLVATAPDEFFCPVDDSQYRAQVIAITTVCVILAMLLFVVSVLYYRNKQTVIAYVYIHLHHFFVCFFSEQDMDEDKIFDAFVSYSSTDRDVALALINELEKKDPPFRLCIHERDWLPGNLITWNIVNSVQNSKRTILVLSKDFLDSMWFQVEFHTAYYQMLEDRIDRLIVIVKGELPPKDSLDKDLQYLISTKTYLIWGERWMWEKLRYAMPHRKHVLPAPAGLALGYKPNREMLKNVENQISILSEKNERNKATQDIHQNGSVATNEKDVTSNNNKPLRPVFKDAKVVATARV